MPGLRENTPEFPHMSGVKPEHLLVSSWLFFFCGKPTEECQRYEDEDRGGHANPVGH